MKFKLNKNLFKVIYEGIEGYVITNNTLECNKGDWTVFTTFTNETITGVASFKQAEWNYASNGLYNLKAIASTFPLGDLPQFIIKTIIPNSEYKEGMFGYTDTEVRVAQNAFKEGWDKHAKKYKFTEEDVKKAIQLAREADSIDGVVDLPIVLNYPNANNSDLQIKWMEEEIIQFLQQPKEITEIEFETEEYAVGNYGLSNGEPTIDTRLKITKSIKYPNGLLTLKM